MLNQSRDVVTDTLKHYKELGLDMMNAYERGSDTRIFSADHPHVDEYFLDAIDSNDKGMLLFVLNQMARLLDEVSQ